MKKDVFNEVVTICQDLRAEEVEPKKTMINMIERGLLRLVAEDNKKVLAYLEADVMRDQIMSLEDKVIKLNLGSFAAIESTDSEKILLKLM